MIKERSISTTSLCPLLQATIILVVPSLVLASNLMFGFESFEFEISVVHLTDFPHCIRHEVTRFNKIGELGRQNMYEFSSFRIRLYLVY